jgi:hypothetical protein
MQCFATRLHENVEMVEEKKMMAFLMKMLYKPGTIL